MLPAVESCAAPGDEDCNGEEPTCTGTHIWSKRFGDASAQSGDAVAIDAFGNIVVAGTLSGTVDFGGGPLTSTGSSDVFVAKLDATGNHAWSRRFGDPDLQLLQAVAIDGSGNIIIAGGFNGTIDFGGVALVSAGERDIFVAKLDPSGNHIWSKRFGAVGHQQAHGVAVDDNANVVLSGVITGSVDFGGSALSSAGNSDVFITPH